jgi:hypothetical protein
LASPKLKLVSQSCDTATDGQEHWDAIGLHSLTFLF